MREPMIEPAGLSPCAAAWRLVCAANPRLARDAPPPGWPRHAALTDLIERLAAYGISAQIVRVGSGELRFISPPAVAELRDGTCWIVRRLGRRRVTVETASGPVELSLDEFCRAFNGALLDQTPELCTKRRLVIGLLALAATHPSLLLRVAFTTAWLQLVAVALAAVSGAVIGTVVPGGDATLLAALSAGVLICNTSQAIVTWVRSRALLDLATRIDVAARRSLLARTLRLPFSALIGRSMGSNLQVFSGLSAARDLLVEVAVRATLDGASAVLFVAFMAWMLPGPTALIVGVAVTVAAATAALGLREGQWEMNVVDAQARERGFLAEMIVGIATIKTATAESLAVNRWRALFRHELSADLRCQRLALWSDSATELARQTLSIVPLLCGVALVLDGHLGLGTLFAYLQLSAGFVASIFGLSAAWRQISVTTPRLAPAEYVVATAVEPLAAQDTAPPRTLAGPVTLEDVWFRYAPDAPWVLRGCNLTVSPLQHHVIDGPSGCGKSTILRLIAGLYVPDRGRIAIAGLDPIAARSRVLYLPQSVQLHAGSIRDNLRLLSGSAPAKSIEDAVGATGLDTLLGALPMGLETALPQGGTSLSGGQRQLLAATAALASARPLLLLDEPFANLDELSASRVRAAFDARNITLITVAHIPVSVPRLA